MKPRSRRPTTTTHRCSKCGTRDLSLFHKDSNAASGLQSYCKACSAERREKWAKSNRVKLNDYMKLWRQSKTMTRSEFLQHIAKLHKKNSYIYYEQNVRDANRRAAQLGNRKEAITVEDWLDVVAEHPCCAKCKTHWGIAGKPSIDHITPLKLGGRNQKENLQPLCLTCNKIKGAKTEKYYAQTLQTPE